ncbi:MAG: hypothetical protein LN588_04965 [Rickettsia endosymbiont of Bryobia graminum]|nr:hypothetical protein [Rickettsia endosymbiont of Bryobia graminum]
MKYYIKKNHLVTNLLAFLISGISGVAINILIIRLYNNEVLGLFYQIAAIFFILSQITTFGIHFSVLSNLAVSDHKQTIFVSAFFTVLVISTISSSILILILHYILAILNKSLYFIIPSLILVSLNKVMISTLNAQGRYHLFAIANGIRVLLTIIGVLLHYHFNLPLYTISSTLTFSESIIFLFLILTHIPYFRTMPSWHGVYHWGKSHISFGKYTLFNGLLVESKIDIIILSLFVNQASIGVYSFATTLGTGFYLLVSVFKNLNSNNISEQLFDTLDKPFEKKIDSKKYILIFVYLIGLITIAMYKIFAWHTTGDQLIVTEGFWIYCIYTVSIMLAARYLLIDNILILANKPNLDNKVRLLCILSNIIFSLILVPFYTIYGAVLAFGLSILINALAIRYFEKKA